MSSYDFTMDPSGFCLLSDYVPQAIQEIRYFSTYNFVGERVDGYEEPCAICTTEAARALKSASKEFNVLGYRIKVFEESCEAGIPRSSTSCTGRWKTTTPA